MDWFKSNRKIQALRSIIENKVFGWKTDRKILVIESDDWGAIRTSNFVAYARFKNLGYDMESSCYNLDSLETNSDLIELYDVLDKFVDHRGRPCCFTANVVTTNPDFEFIEENQFEQYSYESVVDTAYNTEHSDDVVKLWKDGLNSKFFIPQLHCREHIRYWEWLNDLKLGKVEAIETFRYKMCGLPAATSKYSRSYFRTPYVNENVLRTNGISSSELIQPAFDIFEEIFGFVPLSVVAPNVGWTKDTETVWHKNGVKYIQGGKVQSIDNITNKDFIHHYLGQKNELNMTYLVRNCTFEPAKGNKHDCTRALLEIKHAFSNNRPAIISTHRVNYVGRIKKSNRENSLTQLKHLIKNVLKIWPDVEFFSSSELGNLMNELSDDEFIDSIKSNKLG